MNFGIALLLWFSTMALIVANSAIASTVIAGIGPRAADLYSTLVPLPYVALCAWVLARRSPGAGMADALAVGVLWAVSTVVVDVLAARLLQGLSWRLAAVHLRLWEGYFFALVPLAQAVAPAAALFLLRRAGPPAR
ncbi:MAG: hypothetical protein AB7R90_01625 [Reyranellaceae bacterium]